jgi:tetratricopeptide (TPR) repeat protein
VLEADRPRRSPWPPLFSSDFVEQTRSRLHRGRVLVITGTPTGALDRLAADVAGMVDRPSPNRHVARPGDGARPYFAVAQLWFGEHPAVDDDLDGVEHLIRQRLDQRDRPASVVLVGAEQCDTPSIEVLLRLAESDDLRLVTTVAPDAHATLERLRQVGDVVEVGPLDADAIAERLQQRFGVQPEPAVTELVLNRSGGSYELLQGFVDNSVASGLIVVRDDTLSLDDGVPMPDPDEQPDDSRADVLDVTALLGCVDVDEARASFGCAAVEHALARGVLSESDGGLRFVFGVEGAAIRRSMNGDRQRALHDRYSTSLARTVGLAGVAPRAADWWLAAGHLLPVDLAARAAREANLETRFRRALVYTDPAINQEHRAITPVERGYALLELGDSGDFHQMFVGVDPDELTEDELFAYIRAAQVLEDEDDREQLVRQAIAHDDPAVRRRREAIRTLAELVHQTFTRGGDRVASRLRALAFSGQLSSGNRAVTFTSLSAALFSAGRPVQAVESSEFALRSLLDSGEPISAFHLDGTREMLIAAHVAALDLDGAERALEAYSTGPFGTGGGRLSLALQARVWMQHGRVDDALTSALQFLNDTGPNDPRQLRGWVEAMAAECLVHLGRTPEARAALSAADQHPSVMPETDLARRTTMAGAHDAMAEPEVALEILNDAFEEASSRGLLQSAIEAAGAGVLIGGPPQLARLLGVVDDLVDPAGRPLVWQRFARAAHAYDIDSIVQIAIELETKEAYLMAAGVAQFVLDMARRATDLDHQTRAHLAELADLSGRLGR